MKFSHFSIEANICKHNTQCQSSFCPSCNFALKTNSQIRLKTLVKGLATKDQISFHLWKRNEERNAIEMKKKQKEKWKRKA